MTNFYLGNRGGLAPSTNRRVRRFPGCCRPCLRRLLYLTYLGGLTNQIRRGLKARRSRLQETAGNCRKPGYAVQISAVLLHFDCSSRNFEEIKGSELFMLACPFLFLTTSQQNIYNNTPNNQPHYYRRTMASTSTNSNNTTTKSLAALLVAALSALVAVEPILLL